MREQATRSWRLWRPDRRAETQQRCKGHLPPRQGTRSDGGGADRGRCAAARVSVLRARCCSARLPRCRCVGFRRCGAPERLLLPCRLHTHARAASLLPRGALPGTASGPTSSTRRARRTRSEQNSLPIWVTRLRLLLAAAPTQSPTPRWRARWPERGQQTCPRTGARRRLREARAAAPATPPRKSHSRASCQTASPWRSTASRTSARARWRSSRRRSRTLEGRHVVRGLTVGSADKLC